MIFYIYTHWNNQIDVNDIIFCTGNIFLLEYCNNINNNNILTIATFQDLIMKFFFNHGIKSISHFSSLKMSQISSYLITEGK